MLHGFYRLIANKVLSTLRSQKFIDGCYLWLFLFFVLWLIVNTDASLSMQFWQSNQLCIMPKAAALIYIAIVFLQFAIFGLIYYYSKCVKERLSIFWQLVLSIYLLWIILSCTPYDVLIPSRATALALIWLTFFTMARYSRIMFMLGQIIIQLKWLNLHFTNSMSGCFILMVVGFTLWFSNYRSITLQTLINRIGYTSAININKYQQVLNLILLLIVIELNCLVTITTARWLKLPSAPIHYSGTQILYFAGFVLLAILPSYHLVKNNAGNKLLAIITLSYLFWLILVKLQLNMAGSSNIINWLIVLTNAVNSICAFELAQISFMAFCAGNFLTVFSNAEHLLIGKMLGAGKLDQLSNGLIILCGTVLLCTAIILSTQAHKRSISK